MGGISGMMKAAFKPEETKSPAHVAGLFCARVIHNERYQASAGCTGPCSSGKIENR
jgi:hypothetical protein